MLKNNMPNVTENSKPKFICELCDYSCSRLFLWKQHLKTKKHEHNLLMPMLKNDENMPTYICVCNKEYKHIQSYRRHQKNCILFKEKEKSDDIEIMWRVKKIKKDDTQKNNNKSVIKKDNEIISKEDLNKKSENEDLRNMISTLIKQNQNMLLENTEMREILKDVIPRIGNTTINNKFNLNIFLNEQCKDAINLTDFIDMLTLKNIDLETVCENDYVNGVSKMIIRGLKDLDTYKRPIHCTDIKREILYIKDNDEWEKENENKDKIKMAISSVAQKQVDKIKEWETTNPDWKNTSDGKQQYIDMVSNIATEQDTNRIIKAITKEVIIEK